METDKFRKTIPQIPEVMVSTARDLHELELLPKQLMNTYSLRGFGRGLWLPQYNTQAQMVSLCINKHFSYQPHTSPTVASLVQAKIEALLRDDSFQVPSPDAAASLNIGTTLLKWITEHPSEFSLFSTQLVSNLKSCFQASNSRSMRVKSESIWGHYHVMRTSAAHKELWKRALESSGCSLLPTFYQYVTNEVFKQLFKQEFSFSSAALDTELQPITKEEENALRYVAGYICRKVRDKVESSKVSGRDDMLLCLSSLSGDDDEEEEVGDEWTNMIDRGGLLHVNYDTYTLFYLIEEHVRKHLTIDKLHKQESDSKEIIIDTVLKNEDISFQWSMLASTLDHNVSKTLLDMVINEYITLRGFAFGASCLELYKQKSKKTLQKKKGIRKKLCT